MTAEHPIFYTADSVRAYLEDRKTQTRRVIKPQPIWKPQNKHFIIRGGWAVDAAFLEEHLLNDCPYGQVGDRLWVRETWATDEVFDAMSAKQIEETLVATVPKWYKVGDLQLENVHTTQGRWRPSIHMPRWASRLTQTITEVRVGRVQEITEEDAEREGVSWSPVGSGDNPETISAVENFAILWDSLNAKRGYGWNTNPWVWVISYPKYSDEPTRTSDAKTNNT